MAIAKRLPPSTSHRILSFVPPWPKAKPAKARPRGADAHQAAMHLIDHVQVLIGAEQTEAILLLERQAALFRDRLCPDR
jgi:hypothetical protein